MKTVVIVFGARLEGIMNSDIVLLLVTSQNFIKIDFGLLLGEQVVDIRGFAK